MIQDLKHLTAHFTCLGPTLALMAGVAVLSAGCDLSSAEFDPSLDSPKELCRKGEGVRTALDELREAAVKASQQAKANPLSNATPDARETFKLNQLASSGNDATGLRSGIYGYESKLRFKDWQSRIQQAVETVQVDGDTAAALKNQMNKEMSDKLSREIDGSFYYFAFKYAAHMGEEIARVRTEKPDTERGHFSTSPPKPLFGHDEAQALAQRFRTLSAMTKNFPAVLEKSGGPEQVIGTIDGIRSDLAASYGSISCFNRQVAASLAGWLGTPEGQMVFEKNQPKTGIQPPVTETWSQEPQPARAKAAKAL
jgi:hypothetical protein